MIQIFALQGSALSWLSFPLENEIRNLWEKLSIDRSRVVQCLLLDTVSFRGEHQTLFSRWEICHYKCILLLLCWDTWEKLECCFWDRFSLIIWESVSFDTTLIFRRRKIAFSPCNCSKYSCALLANLARSLLLIVNRCNNRAMFLVLGDCALRAAAQLPGTRGLHNLSITSRWTYLPVASKISLLISSPSLLCCPPFLVTNTESQVGLSRGRMWLM